MPTADLRVDLALKRFLSQNRLSTNFLVYLRQEYLDLGSRIFPASGLFTFPVTVTPNWGAGKLDFSPDPAEGIDNAGHVLQLETATRCVGISFANVVGHHYWLGIKYIEVPDGVYANPRTGIAEYDMVRNEVGEKADPTSVVDTGLGTITLNVNSIFQAGASHAGRTVMVWLKNPISIDVDVAIEIRTVSYAAPNNTITTVGALGQGTISVNPVDYYVACLGVTIYDDGVVLGPCPFGPEYVVFGYVVGGAPGSVSAVDQIDLSGGGGHTLQKAYDGLAGSGSGRIVSAGYQAIELLQANTVYRDCDIGNSALRIRKDIPTTLHGAGFMDEGGIDISTRFEAAHSILARCSIHDMTGSDELRVEEDVDIINPPTDTLTFTRVGVDLTLASSTYSQIAIGDLVEITGSVLGNNGLYGILAVAAGTLTCFEYNSTVVDPGWVAEAGLKARIFRPVVRLNNNSQAIIIKPLSDFYRDFNAGIAMPSGQVTVFSPVNTHDDEKIFYNTRDTEYFYTTAEGTVRLTGNIYSDVDTGTLNFTGAMLHSDAINMNGRSIHCDDGYISNVGFLSMTAVGPSGLGIDMNASVLNMDGGDITNADDITSTTGDILATIGDISAGNHVTADNNAGGTGDFKYGLAKTYISYYHPEDFGCQQLNEDWKITPGKLDGEGAAEYSSLISQHNLADNYTSLSIHLPIGVTIVKVEALVYQAAANQISMEIEEQIHDWAGEALADRTKVGGPYTNAVAGGHVRVITSGVIAKTITDGSGILIMFKAITDSLAIYGVKVTYTVSTVKGIS